MGRHPTGKEPAQPLRKITTRHREIMYLLIRGLTGVEISEKVGISQSRLSIIRNSPLFKSELSELESLIESRTIEKKANLNARVTEMQFKALDALGDILDSEDTVLPMKRIVANDLLDLGELRRQNKGQASGSDGSGGW